MHCDPTSMKGLHETLLYLGVRSCDGSVHHRFNAIDN
jgi:hypothetical protein